MPSSRDFLKYGNTINTVRNKSLPCGRLRIRITGLPSPSMVCSAVITLETTGS